MVDARSPPSTDTFGSVGSVRAYTFVIAGVRVRERWARGL